MTKIQDELADALKNVKVGQERAEEFESYAAESQEKYQRLVDKLQDGGMSILDSGLALTRKIDSINMKAKPMSLG